MQCMWCVIVGIYFLCSGCGPAKLFVDYTVCIIIIHVCVCTFVGCCLATRGARGLLWAKGWVWLTESWPVGLLGNSQQNCYITLGCMSCIATMYVHFIGGNGHRNF